jgi:uncharacterized membrane protein
MTDEKLERIVATLLRTGVTLAAIIVLAGGIGYLLQHANDRADYHTFRAEPATYRSVSQIVAAAFRLDWMAVIQLGLLLLIATPIARVGFALIAFALERDRIYVVVTSIVFAILLYSFIATH